MSLPVSQYEALLAEVRGLRQKVQSVQQLADPLITTSNINPPLFQNNGPSSLPLNHMMDFLVHDGHVGASSNYTPGEGETASTSQPHRRIGDGSCSDDDIRGGSSTRGESRLSVNSEPPRHHHSVGGLGGLYHGTWPTVGAMWNSEPVTLSETGRAQGSCCSGSNLQDFTSVMSFAASAGGVPLDRVLGTPDRSRRSSKELEAKVDMVYSLLSMLGNQEHADMGETLLALSTNPESCLAMRQSGCIPLLVQLVQSDRDSDTRKKASLALHNLVHSQTDEKIRKREVRIFKLLEHLRCYTDALKNDTEFEANTSEDDADKHPVQTIAHLMKLSFDEGHRQAICQLGGIHTIAILVEVEHSHQSSVADETQCVLLRRYACMALTNLTFGDSGNKALLCSYKNFMRALVIQLQSSSDELRQVTASVLRNLSWRPDSTSKEILKEVGCVTGLMKAAMLDNKENTLKSILSALWNLSAHCIENKSEICSVEGALGFLVNMLTYKTPSKSLSIIENSGGILRNISSQIAVRDDYRQLLRQHGCLQILLEHLKSPSLTIVSNACGTLWNLSAKCAVDQEMLWKLGAPEMLRSLNHSKHKMIAMGSSAALKNLLSAKPAQTVPILDSTSMSLDLPSLPTLGARKQKALLQELDQNLSETYENIEKDSPVRVNQTNEFTRVVTKKDSKDYLYSHLDNTSCDLTNAFSSLNISRPSTSFSTHGRVQNTSSNSLPYVNVNVNQKSSVKPSTYIPLRNKYSDCTYDDEIEPSDQPIDYSRKYSETKLPSSVATVCKESSTKQEKSYIYSNPKCDETFYAETDLDQPTDYSLRYAENDSDSEELCPDMSSAKAGKFQQNAVETGGYVPDTVKTYFTEDTPYETPFNFSTATSMSDLRQDVIDNDKLAEEKGSSKEMAHLDEKDHCSTEDLSDFEGNQVKSSDKPKTEFSYSGQMSPEKPVNYCEEGTPGYFSRVSSFSSLNSIPVNEAHKNQPGKNDSYLDDEKEKTLKSSPPAAETKAVKFEQVVNYAEETPLMFSRSSSLGSLGSIEPSSIHDDQSSVISDFSRLNSGIISPSELPDSPGEMSPHSPKRSSQEFPSTSKVALRKGQHLSKNIPLKMQPSTSIFEDNVTKFKEESTPIQFSTATSLSNLTIDDDEPKLKVNTELETREESDRNETDTNANNELAQISEDEGDEDILAACINSGMQNNRYCQKNVNTANTNKVSSPAFNSKQSFEENSSSSPIIVDSCRTPSTSVLCQKEIPSNDTITTYCTENTPAGLSHAGSNSDLSVLSIPCTDRSNMTGDRYDRIDKAEMSDDSNLSEENEYLLAKCIQSAMPKSKIAGAVCKEIISSNILRRHIDNSNGADAGASASAGAGAISCGMGVNNNLSKNSYKDFSSNETTEKYKSIINRKSDLKQARANTNINNNNNSQLNDLSRHDSLSSLESTGVSEADMALLEQCISLGMQKSKENALKASEVSDSDRMLLEKCISSAMPKGKLDNSAKSKLHPSHNLTEKHFDERSKNGNVASAAGNTVPSSPDPPATAADVPDSDGARARTEGNTTSHPATPHGTPTGTSQARCSPTTGNSSPGSDRSGYDKKLSPQRGDSPPEITNQAFVYHYATNFDMKGIGDCLSKSCEETQRKVDNRMLDPDAMIESLDRFTAELVSQASHLTKEDKFKTSVTENTWNDDSPNEITFTDSVPNVVTFSSDSEQVKEDELQEKDELDGVNEPSNDFSSINTSTMTESTLIAMEASKMVSVFQKEAAAMSHSYSSVASLELDQIEPPSHLNSLSNSFVGSLEHIPKDALTRSPKLLVRKRSGSMFKQALNNSMNHSSESHGISISNLDHVTPPSALGEIIDLENSMTSVKSLPSEGDFKTDFVINGVVSSYSIRSNSSFSMKQPNSILQITSTTGNSLCNIDQINPPSLLNEITDMCNSLADVGTEAIGSETEIFEDCRTHLGDTVYTENDVTEFSDANSVTPIQSDLGSSSSDSTPKKSRGISKQMTSKQRRTLAKERYKTYTIAAEMVMKEEIVKQSGSDSKPHSSTVTEDYMTVNLDELQSESSVFCTPVQTFNESVNQKVTPKERRVKDKSRYQTQVVHEAVTDVVNQPVIPSVQNEDEFANSDSDSLPQSPKPAPRTRLSSVRRSFAKKRLENPDRFKTQTIQSTTPPLTQGESELHLHLETEANKVLKTLKETKTRDEFLDCETLSLVSNDDDSENNSASSVNYRTYHKSWGCKKNNIPIIQSSLAKEAKEENVPLTENEFLQSDDSDHDEKVQGKPKIVKPHEEPEYAKEEVNVKAVRGKRKPLYSKTPVSKLSPRNIKQPIKTITNNLVKNVTSTLKSGTNLRSVINKVPKPTDSKPPVPRISRPASSSGYSSKGSTVSSKTPSTSNKSSPKRMPSSTSVKATTPTLERQGTFTKNELKDPKSRIPTCISKIPTSRIARAIPTLSKIPAKTIPVNSKPPIRTITKSASSDRAVKNVVKPYSRSTSAESRDSLIDRKIQSSSSSQSLKTEVKNKKPAAAGTRSDSNSSLNSTGSSTAKKQVTSKIASLWKKIEESKKQPPKVDKRVWIQPDSAQGSGDGDHENKRVSRLGSFEMTDDSCNPQTDVVT